MSCVKCMAMGRILTGRRNQVFVLCASRANLNLLKAPRKYVFADL